MKINIFSVLIACTSLYATQIQMKACPGEGPNPFSLVDITSQLPTPKALPTAGNVKDFVVAESTNSLYYRNESARIYKMDLENEKNTYLTRSNLPLSPIMDDAGRYLMTQKANFIFDMLNAEFGWNYLGAPSEESLTPLYWKRFPLQKRDAFFEIANWRDRKDGKQHLAIYSYSQGQWQANHCDLTNIQGTLKLGEGHFAPNVFLYETIPSGENTKLRLWNISIAGPKFTCKPTLAYQYVHTIPGQVRSVSQFEGSQIFAVRTTDKERNLIWTNKENNKRCRYLNFAERDSFVISNHQPVVAAWNKYEGLTLVYPDEEKRATILPGSQYFPIKKENIWMSDEGDRIISSVPVDYGLFELYQMQLK